MFQYAAVKGIARRKGYEYCIPNHNQVLKDPYDFDVKIEIFHPFKLTHLHPHNIRLLDRGYAPVAEEKHFHFDQLLFDMCPDEISIYGFFQSEKYFKHIEQEIREDFEFKDEILEPCKEMMDSVENAISLHVRRTDYIQNPNHAVLDLSYYEQALKHFDESFPVLVFSDDVEWCKQQEFFSDNRCMISESNDHYIDMCLMTLCDHHIIANSSFSWWGAWLAGDSKKIIAPSKWFGPGNQHLETKDLIPENWVII